MDPLITLPDKLKELCRVCLKRHYDMISIFKNKDSPQIISDRIMSCSNVIIVKNDNFPNEICKGCLDELDTAVRFKEKCGKADKKLQKLYKMSNYEVNNVEFDSRSETCTDEKEQIKTDKIQNETENVLCIKKENNISSRQNFECEDFAADFDIADDNFVKTDNFDKIDDHFVKTDDNFDKTIKKKKNSMRKSKRNKGRKKIMKFDELKCGTCNLVCQSKWVLNVHLRTHSGERPYQCELCLKRFVSNSNMRMHKQLQHNEEKQVCSECGKSFSCLTYLKRHLVRHLDVKPHGCSVCQRRFTTKAYLKEHMARHRGDKKYFCELCGGKFVSTVNLKQHMLVHGVHKQNYKRHECTFCDYKTTGKVDLARHIRKHTGERPFQCPYDGCASAFAGKPSLNLHIRIHTGEKPYACRECPAKFSRGDKFKNHMVKKHNSKDVGPSKRSRLVIPHLLVEGETGVLHKSDASLM